MRVANRMISLNRLIVQLAMQNVKLNFVEIIQNIVENLLLNVVKKIVRKTKLVTMPITIKDEGN